MTAAHVARQELNGFQGRLIDRDDPDYEAARPVYNAMIDKRPGLIAQCASVEDVRSVVRYARKHGILLAVRGGGHNGAGFGTCDHGIVLDLSGLDGVSVDPAARTARVGGGATLAQLDAATGEHGLATPSGIISTTGVGGITLGGGLGHMTRTFGLAIDNLLEAEVVLADGDVVRANASQNEDLFWALRGGGGNFGIVTEFTFRLHPVGTVIAGPTFWDVSQGAEILTAYRDFMRTAPRELNGFFLFASVPPGPPFPEELHFRKVCGVLWCYVGDEASAAAAMQPLLDATPAPLLHGPAPMPHAMIQGAFDGVYPAGDQWYWRAELFNEIADEAIPIHAKFGAAMPTWKSTMHLYPVDGATHDVAGDATAWGYRGASFNAVFAGVDPDPANAEAIKRWAIDYNEALKPYGAGGAYLNMIMDEGTERVKASFAGNYDKLARVKAEYDPSNLFRVNQNIPPANN
jgi:FAD/FMN-containing dehydrogenase